VAIIHLPELSNPHHRRLLRHEIAGFKSRMWPFACNIVLDKMERCLGSRGDSEENAGGCPRGCLWHTTTKQETSTTWFPTRPQATPLDPTPPAESPRAGELKRHQRPRVAPRLSRAERKGWPSGGRIRPPSRLSCPSPETDERRDGNISAVIFTRIHSVRIPWGPVTSLRGLPESYSFPEGENAGIALVPV